MSATTPEALRYKRSTLVRVARGVLQVAQKSLPGALYRGLYNGMKKVHRLGVRAGYVPKVFAARLSGNAEARHRREIVYKLMPYTLGGPKALESTYDIVSMAEREQIAGALVECGVAQGGCSAVMALASQHHGSKRPMWLFDSYEGLPDPTADDFKDGEVGKLISPLFAGMCLGTTEQVEELLFKRLGLDRSHITLVKGWFQDTLPVTREKVGPVAVLRLDGDWYESTKCCLDNLYDNVSPGGFIIIDDYGTCYGAEKAVTEFIETRRIATELRPDGRGGAWFRKPR